MTGVAGATIPLLARQNPFRTDRVEAIRYQPQGWTWTELLGRLETMNFRGAIVGNMGAGKTTLLEDLSPRLASLGFTPRFLRLDRDAPQLAREQAAALIEDLDPRAVILLDGCEQMPFLTWKRFRRATRHAAGLIITTHRPGRLPTLVTCRPSADVLRIILNQLVDEREAATIDVEALHARHSGNVRAAIRELYDRAAFNPCERNDP